MIGGRPRYHAISYIHEKIHPLFAVPFFRTSFRWVPPEEGLSFRNLLLQIKDLEAGCVSAMERNHGEQKISESCVVFFFFWGGGRLFLKIGSFVETKPMLPDEWFYSFWLNKFVDCAVLQQKLFVFFLCFVFQCYRHDITCRLWQFIRGFQWVPESMRQFAGTTVITDCNFWCRNVGCNILHCNTALLDVFSRSLGAPYRGEFDSKSMFPFLQNSKYIIPTPSSFKKR